MPNVDFQQIYDHVMNDLLPGLPPILSYHGKHHTLDVLEQVERIARLEGRASDHELLLLKIAALYHDTGFLIRYAGHEEAGCELARKDLPGFGLDADSIEQVCGMILATKIPQSPQNKLEEIICDADLDYLGRPDFFSIANTLFVEMKEKGLINNERDWNIIQVKFINKHRYFTQSNIRDREAEKQKHLREVEALI